MVEDTLQHNLPWYDSSWFSCYLKAKGYIERHQPDELDKFMHAMSVFRTDNSFSTQLVKDIFSDDQKEAILKEVNQYKITDTELHELERFGRLVVHDNPYFDDLQEQTLEKVEALVDEKLECSYNFFSFYLNDGHCPLHMDSPSAKWTLDYCIDQSAEWPICLSDTIPWPEYWQDDNSVENRASQDWVNYTKQSANFDSISMKKNEAVIFSGSSQWHYRDKMVASGSSNFCKLLFLHYIPKGSADLLTPSNWENIIGIDGLTQGAELPNKKF